MRKLRHQRKISSSSDDDEEMIATKLSGFPKPPQSDTGMNSKYFIKNSITSSANLMSYTTINKRMYTASYLNNSSNNTFCI